MSRQNGSSGLTVELQADDNDPYVIELEGNDV